MSSAPAPAVVEAAERAESATLIFDIARVDANMRAIADAARAVGATVLFAAKSFPLAEVRALAARRLDGFDVASPGELADAVASRARVVSIADPTGAALAVAAAAGALAAGTRVIASCDGVAQVAMAPRGADIAIRLSASAGGRDPAVGAVLDGASGRRRSRFGVDSEHAHRRAEIVAIARAAAGRRVGVHVHHGPVAIASAERFVAGARDAVAAAHEGGVDVKFLNLGGAWHGIADVSSALVAIRAAIPANIEIILEPGRAFADGAGFAVGRVVGARALADRELRVVDVSRICHLRWSHVALVGRAPAPGAARPTLWAGPTCYEEDVIGEWPVDPAQYACGARVMLRDVSGYALAWNVGFGGVAAAKVVVVGGG